MHFRLLGFPIRLHYSWLVAFCLLTWALSTAMFKDALPGVPMRAHWAAGLQAQVDAVEHRARAEARAVDLADVVDVDHCASTRRPATRSSSRPTKVSSRLKVAM